MISYFLNNMGMLVSNYVSLIAKVFDDHDVEDLSMNVIYIDFIYASVNEKIKE